MPDSDAFALGCSRLNEFLFAPVGTEANGMTLRVVSVFARLGNDPWLEAGKLAGLPKLEATESLARIITSMPSSVWPEQAATAIAARLIALLPMPSGPSGPSLSASNLGTTAGCYFGVVVALAMVACAVAYQANLFTRLDPPKPDRSSVASFPISPPH